MSTTAPGSVEALPSDWTRLAETQSLANNGSYALYHVSDDEYAVVYNKPGANSGYDVPCLQTVDIETHDIMPVVWTEVESRAGREFTVDEKTAVNTTVEGLIRETFTPIFNEDSGADAATVPVVMLSDEFFAVKYDTVDLRERLAEELPEEEELTPDRAVELLEGWAGKFLCGLDFKD